MTKYSIGKVASQLTLTLRTLRFYEERGLITATRGPGGKRYYTADDIARLEFILMWANTGMKLNDIAELLNKYDPGTEKLRDIPPYARSFIKEAAAAHIKEYQAKTKQLADGFSALQRYLRDNNLAS